VLRPGVEGVVDRQFELKLALVIDAEEGKAVGDREQARRFGCRAAILRDIGAVDDPGKQGDRRIVDLVLIDECLERALVAAMGVFRTGCVEACRPPRSA
jgi:hypothetical protein